MVDLDAPPAPDPQAKHAVVEADHLCECGYNLHGQRITRDERLGISVVRCPECGRYDAAGKGSTAAQAWLRRIGSFALLLYVLIIVGVCLGVGTLGIALDHVWTEVHTYHIYAHPDDGRPIDDLHEFENLPQYDMLTSEASGGYGAAYVYLDTMTPAELSGGRPYGYAARIGYASLPPGHRANAYRPPLWWTAWYVGLLALLGLIVGTFNAALLWHLRGWRRFLPLAVTLGLSVLAWLLMLLSNATYFGFAHREAALAVAVVQGSLLGGWLLGLALGRPIARGVLSILVPPRPRQALAHLWHADGKAMPMSGSVG